MRGVAAEDAHHRVRRVVLHAPDLEGEHLELAVEVHDLVHDVRHHERVDEVALDLDVFVWQVGHAASRGVARLRRSRPSGPRPPQSTSRSLDARAPGSYCRRTRTGAGRRRSNRTREIRMTARTGRTRLLVTTGMVLILQFVLATAASVACAAAASPAASPSAPAHQPTVNWAWLAVGLGGSIILVVTMFLLTRVFGKRRPRK